MTNNIDIFTKIEEHQRSAIQAISSVTSDCKSGSKPVYEIADQLVYLKYYVSCCFQVEKDAMVQFGYIQYKDHRNNHDNILDDLKELLTQCSLPQAETAAFKATLLHSIVKVLINSQEHIAKHNRDLIAFMSKLSTQPARTPPPGNAPQKPVQHDLAKLDKYLQLPKKAH
jgi:hemerythrin